ncbi:hypothetical protein Glove_99g161 [Diversispora epigaea]|uniref:Methyltransferase domain-containing protein n=1 Tax=Diversispora epigaea TaxID=1348612 RepID=A0A397J5A5_9GLOM|nr:hypothetical protein Glove_99g161 [Diversispora epigaea]
MGLFFSHDRSYRVTKFLTNSEKIKEKIETHDNALIPNFDWLDGETFPTKIEENHRIHAQHFALKHVCKGNFTSPINENIKPGFKILDVGCGSGQWCIEMAQMFPDVEVYGFDLSPCFPVSSDWSTFIKEIKRVLKPGGIIEQHECDGLAHSVGPLLNKVQNTCIHVISTTNDIDLRFARRLSEVYETAGFENIHESYLSLALGKWGGRIGEICADNLKHIYLTMQPWLTPFTGLTEDEYNRIIKQIVVKELDEYNSYTNHHIIWAKKKASSYWWFY